MTLPLITVFARASAAPSALLTSLISYWKLDEASAGAAPVTRNDSHGTNHLTDVNNAPSMTGVISNAANLASKRLSIASNASLQAGDIDFTLTCWVRMTTLQNAGLMGKWGSGGAREYTLYYNHTDHVTNARFSFTVSSNGTLTTFIDATSFGAPAINTWYFVAAWHDSVANTINIQVNNGTVNSAAHTTGVAVLTSPFLFGQIFAAVYQLLGGMDECGFWKRVLTSGERTALYNSGNGLTYPFA